MKWYSGINNFKEHTLSNNRFHINYNNDLIDYNLNLEQIYVEHLRNRTKHQVEVIYSGGLDSEAILLVCKRNNIPVKARTVKLYFDDLLVNGYDLYHVDKFCRMYDISVTYMDIDLTKYYMSDIDIKLSSKYHFHIPYASVSCYALGYTDGYAMVGGDYPWPYIEDKIWKIKPPSIGVNSYDRFFMDNGIEGIGNMQTHSLTSLHIFIKKHIETYYSETMTNHNNKYNDFYFEYLKNNLFKNLGLNLSFRFKQHGFEHLNRYRKYHDDITKEYLQNFPVPTYSATFPNSIYKLLNEYSVN